jgi:two-component sensor histidine kinase
MQSIVEYLFGAASFVPHGYCLLWRPDLVALHAVSDVLIAAAYLAIPAAIVVFVRRRRDLAPEHRRIAALFVAFIVACALTHLAGLATLWYPYYGLQGLVKAGTAAVSLVTAVAVWPLIPRFLSVPSASQLVTANARLAEETQARQDVVEELKRVNRELEERVERRTRELRDVTQRFEVAALSSRTTIYVQDQDLRFKWIYNPRPGFEPERVIGRRKDELLPAETAAQFSDIKHDVMEDGQPRDREVVIDGPAGTEYLRLHVAPERDVDGSITGVICALVDVTAEHGRTVELERATGALAEANRRFDQAISGSSISVFRQDADLRYTWLFNPPPGMAAETFIGHTDEEALPEPASRIVAVAKREVLATGEPRRVEAGFRIDGRTLWYDIRIEPLVCDDGVVRELTSVAVDITPQKEYHHHLRVVMRELTHRSKNLLAVVQGIARQTAQSVDGLPAFVERFGARLQALAHAHDLLVDGAWHGAAIDELISTQLGHVLERRADRIKTSGPSVLLKPEAAQNLALALHELSTNAAKYGALSTGEGEVRVEWGPVEGDDGLFEITWTEEGGPPAVPPAKKGFGSVMIERLVPRAIDGTAEVSYDETGFRWRLTFPNRFLADVEVNDEDDVRAALS